MIEKLKQFTHNRGLMRANKPPKPNEPFYDFYIEAMINEQHIELGDEILVVDKNSNGLTGKVIEDPRVENTGLILLTSGKKIWKSRKNVRYIPFRNILSVEKICSAENDFDILTANPGYKHVTNISIENNEDYDEAFKRYFVLMHPNLKYDKAYSLCIHSSLYCPFTNADVVKGRILIITKDDDVEFISDLKLKHLYPNRNYYNLCEKTAYSEYVIVPFATYEEMNQVKCIATFWTILIDDVPVHTLELTYLSFMKNEKAHIYNIQQESTFFDVYNESLTIPSVFSGRLYSKYDTVSVILNEEEIYNILGEDSEVESILLDIILASHEGSLTKILMSLCDETQIIKYIEAYKSTIVVKGSRQTSDMTQLTTDWYDEVRKKLDFQRLFRKDISL